MKHCAKSPDEPTCLATWRAANPDATWDAFRKEAPANGRRCYDSVRDRLRDDQGALCVYCETRLEATKESVEHFHPKSDRGGTCNWAFEWPNLWLCCMGGRRIGSKDHPLYPTPENLSCDAFKADRILDGRILCPDEVPSTIRIFRFDQSTDRLDIRPEEEACRSVGLDPEKVQRTIDELNLNCARLAAARLAHHAGLEQEKKRLRASGRRDPEDLERFAAHLLAKDAEGYYRHGFFTVTRWSLGAAAERLLGAHATSKQVQ